jgi:3-phenylpropionate/cinnamic acid dioxygenase small subunit
MTDAVRELVARKQIEEVLIRRGRGADAKDPDAIVTAHVPGSRDTHGIFDGTIEQFAEFLRTHNYQDDRYGSQRHTIGNVLVEFESPDTARVESYHLAYHRLVLDGLSYDVEIGGRYLDICTRRSGQWLIDSRAVVYDWSRSSPATEPDRSRKVRMTRPDEFCPAPVAADSAIVADLLAKQQITEVLYRRARAGDRRDVELALSCYHPDATENHEGFDGTAAEFIQNVSMISPNSTAPVDGLWHLISNVLIDLRGDEADVESYHIAVVIRHDDGVESESRIGGRYLDRFAYRDGRWAIAHRDVVFDWSRVDPPSKPYWDLVGLDESALLRGAFGPDDPLYSQLGIARG